MTRRCLTFVIVCGVVLGFSADPAFADHLVVEVSAPSEVIVGEELEIIAVVNRVSDGEPVEGTVAVFFADAFFAGVSGEIRLGSAETNSLGIATFNTSFAVRGIHGVRIELEGDPIAEPAAVTIGVDIGPQIVASEAGVDIPGVGSWLVTFVIGAVWAVMIVAALWIVRLSRSDGDAEDPMPAAGEDVDQRPVRKRLPSFNLAAVLTGLMIVSAVGLVVILLRSPNTHHNFDPEGYDRSPVAYLDAAYIYPGLGLTGAATLTGDAVTDGQTLFLTLGCASCHGLNAQGAAAAGSPAFATRSWLGTVVRTGLPGGMPAYSESDVTEEDLDTLNAYLLFARDSLAGELPRDDPGTTATTTTAVSPTTTSTTTSVVTDGDSGVATPSFADVQQILQSNCAGCHGTIGGWSAADHSSVVNSGDSGPAVIPGDPDASILAQKLLDTQTFGTRMPPSRALDPSDIEIVLAWIAAGAAP